MLTLHLSKNLGITYKEIEKFENLIAANEYIDANSRKLEKGRWFIADENGHIFLVCSVFEAVARQKIGDSFLGISEDLNLRRYLLQQKVEKAKEK